MCSAPSHASWSLWVLLQFLDILREVEDPKLDPAYQAKPHQSQIERDNNFLQSSSHSPLSVAQHVVHHIHIESALLVKIQLDIPHPARPSQQDCYSATRFPTCTDTQGYSAARAELCSSCKGVSLGPPSGFRLKLFPLAYHQQEHIVFISQALQPELVTAIAFPFSFPFKKWFHTPKKITELQQYNYHSQI